MIRMNFSRTGQTCLLFSHVHVIFKCVYYIIHVLTDLHLRFFFTIDILGTACLLKF